MKLPFGPSNSGLTHVRQLALVNMNLLDLFHPLSKFYYFDQLTRLDLLKCTSSGSFLSALGDAFRGKLLQLQDLAVVVLGSSNTGEEFGACFLDIFMSTLQEPSCDAVDWDEEMYSPIQKKILSSGQHPRALSIFEEESHDPPLGNADFDELCVACPALEQLGYALAETYIGAKAYPLIKLFSTSPTRNEPLG
jgi:hypothetical protein